MGAAGGAVAVAVQDQHPEVRGTALATLEDMREFAPVGRVAELALTDPIPRIRMTALELVADGDRDVALDALNRALFDSDPQVSELAQDLLNELEREPSD